MLTRKQVKKNNHETFTRLGRQLYERRMMYGVTLEELAMKTNVSPHYFDHVESGRAYIHWGMLSYLASFYDCKIKIDLEFCAEGDAAADADAAAVAEASGDTADADADAANAGAKAGE